MRYLNAVALLLVVVGAVNGRFVVAAMIIPPTAATAHLHRRGRP